MASDEQRAPEVLPFRERHLKCSMVSDRAVYKHDADCPYKNESIDGSKFRRASQSSGTGEKT
jgi:hypothetical protein